MTSLFFVQLVRVRVRVRVRVWMKCRVKVCVRRRVTEREWEWKREFFKNWSGESVYATARQDKQRVKDWRVIGKGLVLWLWQCRIVYYVVCVWCVVLRVLYVVCYMCLYIVIVCCAICVLCVVCVLCMGRRPLTKLLVRRLEFFFSPFFLSIYLQLSFLCFIFILSFLFYRLVFLFKLSTFVCTI